MGVIYSIKCEECKSEWTLFLGQGMLHGNLSVVLKNFPAGVKEKLNIKAMEAMDTPWSFSFEPGYSKGSGKFIAVPVLMISEERKMVIGKINLPTKDVKLLKIGDIPKCPCPVCESDKLAVIQSGCWD